MGVCVCVCGGGGGNLLRIGGGNLLQIKGPAEACTDGVGVSRGAGTEHRKAEASSAAAMVPFRFVGDAEKATNPAVKSGRS